MNVEKISLPKAGWLEHGRAMACEQGLIVTRGSLLVWVDGVMILRMVNDVQTSLYESGEICVIEPRRKFTFAAGVPDVVVYRVW